MTESTIYAEEIVQDVFLKLWLKRAQLEVIDDFEAYFFVLARNHIYSYLKALARHQVVSNEVDLFIPIDLDTPAERILSKEYAALVYQAVRTLPKQQYEVYRLSKEEGKTRDQIAEYLQISPETVKVHLSRSMRSIRMHLLGRITLTLACLAYSLGV